MNDLFRTLVSAFMLILLTCVNASADTGTYKFMNYGSTEESTEVVSEPDTPYLNGGTIFKITYDDNVPFLMKAAFEHACKLWQDYMPQALPITIAVRYGSLGKSTGSNQPLSYVTAPYCCMMPYMKYRLLSNMELNINYSDIQLPTDTLDLNNPDLPDITITYNSDMSSKFSYSLSNDSKTGMFDFVSVALRDIQFGLGIFNGDSVPTISASSNDLYTCAPIKAGEIARANTTNLNWDSLGWFPYIFSSTSGGQTVAWAHGSSFVAPYTGSFTFDRGKLKEPEAQNTGNRVISSTGSNDYVSSEDILKDYCRNYVPFFCSDGIFVNYYVGTWCLSVLKTDGTWKKLSLSYEDGSSISYTVDDLNISSIPVDSLARTSKGLLRLRLDWASYSDYHMDYQDGFNVSTYYFGMEYLPQFVTLDYLGYEYIDNTTSSGTTSVKYHKIGFKDIEGVNYLRFRALGKTAKFINASDLDCGYIKIKGTSYPTLVKVTAYNDNGSTAGGDVSYDLGNFGTIVNPIGISVYNNGNTLKVAATDSDDSDVLDNLKSYSIYPISSTGITTSLTGDFEDNTIIDISSLNSNIYVIDCVDEEGEVYSFKFNK